MQPLFDVSDGKGGTPFLTKISYNGAKILDQ